jgi:hypothetical protein
MHGTPHTSYTRTGLMALLLLTACGERSYDRSEMNPRKEAIYRYASSLCEIDEHASVMSMGPMGAPTNHPARLKTPYPTRADFEAAIGRPDAEETQRMTYTVIGGLGKEEQEDDLALTWWEKDSRWEKYGPKGWEKSGHREIITAWFDPQGRLKKLFILHPYGSEFIGRHSGFWQWAG